jgi:hypothetical protein
MIRVAKLGPTSLKQTTMPSEGSRPIRSAGPLPPKKLVRSLLRLVRIARPLLGRREASAQFQPAAQFRRVSAEHVYGTFQRENTLKDETWAIERLDEATSIFGIWHQGKLSAQELLEVMLPHSVHFGIPPSGLTVRDALKLPEVQVAAGQRNFPESHIFLSVRPVCPWRGGTPEYRSMQGHQGRLVHLDGLNRMLAWALSGKPGMKAFIAGMRPRD